MKNANKKNVRISIFALISINTVQCTIKETRSLGYQVLSNTHKAGFIAIQNALINSAAFYI